jgi:hypothetical protein
MTDIQCITLFLIGYGQFKPVQTVSSHNWFEPVIGLIRTDFYWFFSVQSGSLGVLPY